MRWTAPIADSRRRSGWLFGLWLVLCAATALIHALIPLEAPAIRGTGSAFSASTSAVAVAPSRAAPVVKRIALPRRNGMTAPVAAHPEARIPLLPAVQTAAATGIAAPWPSGVPLFGDSALPSADRARAPPHS